MGLFDKIFPNKTSARHKAGRFAALTAYQPTFTSWNGELFDSDIMRSSIHALATHTAKLKVEFLDVAQSISAPACVSPTR